MRSASRPVGSSSKRGRILSSGPNGRMIAAAVAALLTLTLVAGFQSIGVQPSAAASTAAAATTEVVAIRAKVNNKFVAAENAGASSLIANRSSIGPWELFDLIKISRTDVYLRAHANGRYVCAEAAGAAALISNRDTPAAWETFQLITNGDGSKSLRSRANNKIVVAESAGNAPLIANRTIIGPWEKFEFIPLDSKIQTPSPTSISTPTSSPSRTTTTGTTPTSSSGSPTSTRDNPTRTTATSSTPAPSLPTGSTSVLNLPREPWWGGPSYYAKYPKATASGWTDPSFFPISVFLGKPEHAASLRSIGINTYMGAEHDGSKVSTITGAGISLLAQDEWTTAEIGNDQRVVGWQLSDECEMGYSGCPEDETASLAQQQRYANTARARNDGRFLQANFGNGVLGTYWATTTMDDHVSLVDVSSVDKYAYTSPHVQGLLTQNKFWPAGKNPASAGAYGWLQDRMETFSTPAGSKPNWVFIETAMPLLTDAGATTISAGQIEGAVWNAIIHGASGIAYFQHNNSGLCGNYSLMTCAGARAAVAKVDAQVQSLAPVLNTQPYVWSFGSGLETSLKAYQGSAYVFAMTDGGTGSRTFTLPGALRGTSVEVVGENRTIRVSGGTFTDTFSNEFTHHTYRVAI